MEAIKILVTGAHGVVENAPVITSGMVGLPVELHWDESWDGLHKTLIYKAGDIIRDQILEAGGAVVPGELLQIPYRTLQIGVYGTARDGSVVIPTVWVQVGQIREGVNPVADPGTDPALPIWQQLLHRIEAMEQQKQKLLWEFAVPGRGSTPHDLSWMDNYAFPFVEGTGEDRPWNDRWVEDGQLPADTTMREKANRLCELIADKKPATIEIEINGLFFARGQVVMDFLESEGMTFWKLTMVSGNMGMISTYPPELDVVEISESGISFGREVEAFAGALGWRVRIYG